MTLKDNAGHIKNGITGITIEELARKLGLETVGDAGGRVVFSAAGPDDASGDTLCPVWDVKALKKLGTDVPIMAPAELFSGSRCGIVADHPREMLPRLLAEFMPPVPPDKGVTPSACVADGASVHPDAWVGPFAVVEDGAHIEAGARICAGAFVGRNCRVGENTVIEPRAVLLDGVIVGRDCLLHSGSVIGCDGFGFLPSPSGPVKIPQTGGVHIGDDVEIGACTTIDRGTMSDTVVGSHTKIDNHVQIGHNVKIGQCCIICSMSGIAGSSVIEDGVTISVQAGITDHVRIGAGSVLAARTGITNDVPPGSVLAGYPARPHVEAKRALVLSAELPSMFKRLRKLERTVEDFIGKKTKDVSE